VKIEGGSFTKKRETFRQAVKESLQERKQSEKNFHVVALERKQAL